jgi:hypothetical protein
MRQLKSFFLLLSLLTTIGAASAQLTITAGGNTAGGLVTDVTGNIVTIGGVLQLDVSNAKIVGDLGRDARVSDIKPGTYVHAVLRQSPLPAGAALVADMVAIVRVPQISLHSIVQSVDVANRTFTVLGRVVHVDSNTSFRSFNGGVVGLADVQAGNVVDVEARNDGGQIVASVVQVAARTIGGGTIAAAGIVESITGDQWKIGGKTLTVNAQTKIAGDPKVGDYVAYVAFIDSSNQLLALSIIKSPIPLPNGETTFKLATVKVISPTSWVITPIGSSDVTLIVNDKTKIDAGIRVGQAVIVTAERSLNGLVALTIRSAAPPTDLPGVLRVVGTVAAIGGSEWQIVEPGGGTHPYVVNSSTIIQPGLKVGDTVEIFALVKDGEKPVAISIRLANKTRAAAK